MDLKFPELNGGTVQGLNDAGVENFQGAIDTYLSRECGQNTSDAVRPNVQTARLEFDRIDVPVSEIPAFDRLRQTLYACLEKWGGKEKEREFFEQAIEMAGGETVPVLRISDFGTTGLTGSDTDDKGRWLALVKSQGVSNKEDTAGGSFGIGKSSPFAASRFRTVFYGTRTESGSVALQGVSRLVTHRNPEGRFTQGIGFIGEYDPHGDGAEPVFRAVRGEGQIPPRFLRTECGTDIWVIGYRSGPGWSDDLVRSILINFWPAIHQRTIEFRVGTQKITHVNLSELIKAHEKQEDFEAHHYFAAIKHEPVRKKLKHVGACELYLTATSPDLPKKICMVRSTGMRIYDYQPRACRVPFSGLFRCTNPDGNKLLRKLEPPKHDDWNPKRIEGPEGKKALDEIKAWIRDEVKKLNPLFAGVSFNENELAKYVPDVEPDNMPSEQSGTSDEESLEPKTVHADPHAKPVQAKPVTAAVVAGDGGQGGGGEGGGGGGGGGTGPKPAPGPKPGRAGSESQSPKISARSYRISGSRYQLVLRSPTDFNGSVRICAVGEDGAAEPVELTHAELSDAGGKPLAVSGGVVQGVQFTAAAPVRIAVSLKALERRSLTVVTQP